MKDNPELVENREEMESNNRILYKKLISECIKTFTS